MSKKKRKKIPRYFKITPLNEEDEKKAKTQEKVMNWFFHEHRDTIMEEVLKRLGEL